MRHSIILSTAALAFVASTMLCGCKESTQSDNAIQITKDDVISLDGTFYDNYLDSWEYILLEESPESAIGSVERIRYDDGLFFVHDNMNSETTIKVFDRSGHFLNNIGRLGRARNEYLNLDHWDLDVYRNEVHVINGDGYAGTTSIKRYDYKGNFLGVTKLDTIGKEFVTVNGYAKCLSDGSFLMNDPMHSFPTHEYFILHPDGGAVSLFDLPEYYTLGSLADFEDIFTGNINNGEKMTLGVEYTTGYFNPLSDTTYLMRRLDNRIYRIYRDIAEPVARLTFIPDPPAKYKKGLELGDPDAYEYTADAFLDLKDYLRFFYNENDYVFDKATNKLYHLLDIDDIDAAFPAICCQSVIGNDVIGILSSDIINHALEFMDSKDYDHSYTPQVEAFYRKVKECQNPPIVIAHYK